MGRTGRWIKRWIFLGTLSAVVASLGFLLWRLIFYWQRLLRQPRLLLPAVLDDEAVIHAIEDRALAIASANLRSGIERRRLSSGRELTVLNAGRRHFREPWARDFGFASFGLIEVGELDALRETLELFLIHQRMSGQFPVKIHATNVVDRYLHALFGREQPDHEPLRPKYSTAHNTVSLDGNALLVIAALNYLEHTGDKVFASLHWPALERAVTWIERHAVAEGDLLQQAAFADWADSVARRGRVLYPNVVYWKALHDLAQAASSLGNERDATYYANRAERVKSAINNHFWREDLGYFVASRRFDLLSSAGNLLSIAWGLASPSQAQAILDRIEEFKMASPVPTQVTHRAYPSNYIALENRLAGIGHYHTSAAWLWLGGWHAVALIEAGRLSEAEVIVARLSAVIVRDGVVNEVYDPSGYPLATFWYRSEAPLTWSAAMVVYASKLFSRASQ